MYICLVCLVKCAASETSQLFARIVTKFEEKVQHLFYLDLMLCKKLR